MNDDERNESKGGTVTLLDCTPLDSLTSHKPHQCFVAHRSLP